MATKPYLDVDASPRCLRTVLTPVPCPMQLLSLSCKLDQLLGMCRTI